MEYAQQCLTVFAGKFDDVFSNLGNSKKNLGSFLGEDSLTINYIYIYIYFFFFFF